jgi:predicted nuclease of restriction endonuclease-like (RecB) superfamily
MSKKEDKSYEILLLNIKEKIRQLQYETMRAVNKNLLQLYWEIGKSIVEKQKEHGWGKSIVEILSSDLQKEFPGAKGYSSDNLWRMRKYFLLYAGNIKLAPLVQEISWSHNIIVMEKCKDNLEREFYIQMTIRNGWSKNVLIHQIEGNSYENFLLNQHNFDTTIPDPIKHEAGLVLKDEYNFEFLNLGEIYSERDLEQALVKNIRQFLIEMGGDFALMGHQYRIKVEDEDYFIDLLLYHRKLKSLIAIELKTGKFKPEYAGKMNFYLSLLDDTLKQPEENPSIGIIICKSKSKTIVEYALRNMKAPIGVSGYTLSRTLPKAYQHLLPSPDQIETKLIRFFKQD